MKALLKAALRDFESNYRNSDLVGQRPWSEQHAPVIEALLEKTVFSAGPLMLRTGSGYAGLIPRFFAGSILSFLVDKKSIDAVLSWLQAVFAIESATVRIVTPLWGVSVPDPIKLRTNVFLLPISEIANSPNLTYLMSEIEERRMLDTHSSWDEIDSVLSAEVVIGQVFWRHLPGGSLPPSTEAYEVQQELKLWALAMAIQLVHPVFPALSWIEFVDERIRRAQSWRSYSSGGMDVLPRVLFKTQLIDPSPISVIVDGILKAKPEWRTVLERASQRFRRSMFQTNAMDAALDLFLSLEILLPGRGAQDGIVTRASHLLNAERAAKIEAYRALSQLQKARSQGAHGASGMSSTEQESVLKKCRPLVAGVLRECIALGEKPDMEALQMGYVK